MSASPLDVEGKKRAAGEAAALLVESGMTVGLGTGSTAVYFVAALGARGLEIRGVPTSEATARLAAEVGIRLTTLDEAGELDLTVDGADEIDPDLNCIKGRGGAILREKLVWEASRRVVVIADAAKRVERLGAFPLPVEVVAFGHGLTARRIALAASQAGVEGAAVLRVREGAAVQTDGRNLIYDLPCLAIPRADRLAERLKQVTGVVEHGLFLGLAAGALIGTDAGVEQVDAVG